MSSEKSAIEELRERQLTDAASLNVEEPEIKQFELGDVFEEPEKPKRRLFKKRGEKEATEIKIKNNLEVKPAKEPVRQVENMRIENRNVDTGFSDTNKEITPDDVAPALLEVQPDILDTLQGDDDNQEVDMEIELEKEEVKFVEDEPDIFYEKKRFLVSQYEKAEEYLESHSKNGYHFVKKKGKKFYFKQGSPKNYYYTYSYFKLDPEKSDWIEWENAGWKLVGRATGKNNMEAGWFIFRNELQIGEYKKKIDNDMEKYKFFKRLSNSYRSTVFLFFVIMCICAVTFYLQTKFNGFWQTKAASGCIFALSFIFFVIYARYLWNAKKAASKLKTTLRLKEKDAFIRSQNVPDYSKTEDELNSDWESLNKESEEE